MGGRITGNARICAKEETKVGHQERLQILFFQKEVDRFYSNEFQVLKTILYVQQGHLMKLSKQFLSIQISEILSMRTNCDQSEGEKVKKFACLKANVPPSASVESRIKWEIRPRDRTGEGKETD